MSLSGPPSVLLPGPFLSALVLRTSLLWLGLRAVGSSAGAAEGVPYPSAFLGHPVSALWVALVVVAAVRVEMWRQRELVFLANLGHPFTQVAALVVTVCLLLEVLARVGLG